MLFSLVLSNSSFSGERPEQLCLAVSPPTVVQLALEVLVLPLTFNFSLRLLYHLFHLFFEVEFGSAD